MGFFFFLFLFFLLWDVVPTWFSRVDRYLEEALLSTRYGMWTIARVPHRGWGTESWWCCADQRRWRVWEKRRRGRKYWNPSGIPRRRYAGRVRPAFNAQPDVRCGRRGRGGGSGGRRRRRWRGRFAFFLAVRTLCQFNGLYSIVARPLSVLCSLVLMPWIWSRVLSCSRYFLSFWAYFGLQLRPSLLLTPPTP